MTIKIHVTVDPDALEALNSIDYAALERLCWLHLARECNVPPSLILDFGAHMDVGELLFERALVTPDKGWPYLDTGRLRGSWKS